MANETTNKQQRTKGGQIMARKLQNREYGTDFDSIYWNTKLQRPPPMPSFSHVACDAIVFGTPTTRFHRSKIGSWAAIGPIQPGPSDFILA
jgi:hypothetical protein